MLTKVLVIAVAVVMLSAGVASQAVALPSGHHPKPPPQLTGAQLERALLPLPAIGDGLGPGATLDSGHRLLHERGSVQVPKQSCADFETSTTVSGYGNTAGAAAEFYTVDWFALYPTAFLDGWETVVQFGSDDAATRFFRQAKTKYSTCTQFSAPNPGDSNPGGGSLDYTLLSVNWTSVAGARAFSVINQGAFSEASGVTYYMDVLFAVSGTSVYEFWELSGINDVPYSPMTKLIHRVQALYHHR